MNPIALWLLNQAGGRLFTKVTDALAESIGVKEKAFSESRARNLLDDYSQRLLDASRRVIERQDQDRLALLRSAIDQLKRAPKTNSKQETLADAQSKFSVVAHWPEQGQTGGFSNAHLRSIAFLGLAAVHLELKDTNDVIAEDIGAAIYADSSTAKQWLGEDIIRKLLQVSSAPLSANPMPKATIPSAVSQLIFYDCDTGQGEIYGVGHQGHMSLFKQYRWRKNWTEILPLQSGEKRILLFYDRNAREGEFYSVENNGEIHLLSRYHGWRTSWVQLIASHFSQNYATGLLFYDRRAGEGEFYSLNENGEIHLLSRYHGWRKTWTQILPVDLDSKYAGLLFYDRRAGEGEFYSVENNGEIHLLRRYHGWRTSWVQILSGYFGKKTSTNLLFYDRTAGEGEFYSVDENGKIHLLRRYHGWRKTWTQILSGCFDGEENIDILFYDRTAGEGEFYSVDENGKIHLLRRRHGWRTSWTQLIAFP